MDMTPGQIEHFVRELRGLCCNHGVILAGDISIERCESRAKIVDWIGAFQKRACDAARQPEAKA